MKTIQRIYLVENGQVVKKVTSGIYVCSTLENGNHADSSHIILPMEKEVQVKRNEQFLLKKSLNSSEHTESRGWGVCLW